MWFILVFIFHKLWVKNPCSSGAYKRPTSDLSVLKISTFCKKCGKNVFFLWKTEAAVTLSLSVTLSFSLLTLNNEASWAEMLIWSLLSPFPAPPSSPIRKDLAKIQRRDNPLGYVGAGSLPHLTALAAALRSPLWAYQLLPHYPRSIRQSCFTTPVTPSLPRTCRGSPRVRGLIDVGGGYEALFFLLCFSFF